MHQTILAQSLDKFREAVREMDWGDTFDIDDAHESYNVSEIKLKMP